MEDEGDVVPARPSLAVNRGRDDERSADAAVLTVVLEAEDGVGIVHRVEGMSHFLRRAVALRKLQSAYFPMGFHKVPFSRQMCRGAEQVCTTSFFCHAS